MTLLLGSAVKFYFTTFLAIQLIPAARPIRVATSLTVFTSLLLDIICKPQFYSQNKKIILIHGKYYIRTCFLLSIPNDNLGKNIENILRIFLLLAIGSKSYIRTCLLFSIQTHNLRNILNNLSKFCFLLQSRFHILRCIFVFLTK